MTRRKDVQFAESIRRCPMDRSPCILLIFVIFTWQSKANVRLISFLRCSNSWKVASATKEMTQKWLKGVINSQGSSVFFLFLFFFEMAGKAALLLRGEHSQVTALLVIAHCQDRQEPQPWFSSKFFFKIWTIFKVFIAFVTILLLLFMFWFFGCKACRILALRPGNEPVPSTVEGEVLTTGPLGKAPEDNF